MITRIIKLLLVPFGFRSVFGGIPTFKVPGSNPEIMIRRSKMGLSSLIHGILMVATELAGGELRTGRY